MSKRCSIAVSRRGLERKRGENRFTKAYNKFLKKYSLQEIGIEEEFFRSVRTKSAGRMVSL
jgi:hypothetical protein